jgi:glycosyltransferase involved in cell wall biosynthesis
MTSITMNIKKKEISNRKFNILFEGWINIPHSYAIVNCFQLVHLYKNYNDKINFYVTEKEYYRQEWNEKKKLVYTQEYNDLLSNKEIFKPFDHEKDKDVKIDLIYRITYPYDITLMNWNKDIPVCVFFTSEFSKLDSYYFKVGAPPSLIVDNNYIKTYLNNFKNITFTSPSLWSSLGMVDYIGNDSNREQIISHGVDPTLFYKENEELRQKVRAHYNINPNDILLINTAGATTKNKGIMYILQIMNILVNRLNKKHFKLLLKGTSDLYSAKGFLESYFVELQGNNAITKDEMKILLDNHIIFTEKTLSFKQMRFLYNASDLYISPYIAEGFNLCVLEALACGANVLVPMTGSTKQYIDDIYANGGKDNIYYVKSNVATLDDGLSKINNIDGNDLLAVMMKFEVDILNKKKNEQETEMANYISNNYSWNRISTLLYEHFCKLIVN